MLTQAKASTQSVSNTLLSILTISLGLFLGGLVGLIGLWLWLDYQAGPTHSLLVIFGNRTLDIIPASLRLSLENEAQLMGLPLTAQTSAFWYMARAGGIISYLLLWLSVVWGLNLSTKIVQDFIPAPIAYGLHEFLSIGVILFVALHALVLLGDNYIEFKLFQLAIPFSAPYEPLWTGLGTLAFYLTAALTASFYIRRQIGQKIWRTLHYLTFIAYLLALIHGLMAGTDSDLRLMQLMYLGTGSTVLFLIYYRLFTSHNL